MKQKNVKRWLSVTAIALSMTVTATGCRPSPILEDIVYKDNGTLDPEQQAIAQTQDGQESDEFFDKKDEEAERTNEMETEASTGRTDPDGSTDINADNVQPLPDAEVDAHVSVGEGSGQGEGNDNGGEGSDQGEGSGTGGEGSGFDNNGNMSGDESGEGSGNADTEPEESNQNPDNTGEGDHTSVPSKADVPKKVVTNGAGEEVQIPEDVFTVTAVGPAAAIVEMLGGEGRLIGSSESFTGNELSKVLFPDIEDIHTWWEDAGEDPISDEDFNELLQASPDVCFELSGQNTFTEEQVARLQELEIGYLVLPELTSTDNLKDAVTIVAKALDTNETTGKSAKTIASNYGDWVDSSMEEVEDLCETAFYYSLYIAEWRDDITFDEYDGPLDPRAGGVTYKTHTGGVAIALSSAQEDIMTYMMGAAGVRNTSKLSRNGGALFPLIGTNAYLTGTQKGFYIVPFSPGMNELIFSSDEYAFSRNDSTFLKYYGRWWNGVSPVNGVSDFIVVGNESPKTGTLGYGWYTSVIVADSTIKSRIENNAFWQAKTEERVRSIISIDENMPVTSQTTPLGDYKIFVSPDGMDPWADGSVESPLEAYWVAYKISGTINESLLLSRMRSFYQTFFGVTLSDSQLMEIIE